MKSLLFLLLKIMFLFNYLGYVFTIYNSFFSALNQLIFFEPPLPHAPILPEALPITLSLSITSYLSDVSYTSFDISHLLIIEPIILLTIFQYRYFLCHWVIYPCM